MKKPPKKTVAVIGLGYVGLPLAILAREKGWNVLGVDVDKEKVKEIQAGKTRLEDSGVIASLQQAPLDATTDHARIAEASVIIIAVPTPVTHDKLPDLRPLISSVQDIAPYLKNGQTLVIESTVNPGIMDGMVVPLLRAQAAPTPDLDGGRLYLAYCPERINPADLKWTVRNIPRVLGGYTPEGVKRARQFYESILEAPVKIMQTATEAEAVKIFENSFRDINIAFVNEMAKSFDKLGIDVLNVIAGASTKPFAFLPHFPGNGVGGHCISVDPYYMIERGREVNFDHKFLKLAREINDSMPAFTVKLMDRGLKQLKLDAKKTSVALLGLAYKKDTADTRESPALTVRNILEKRGVKLAVFDPFVKKAGTVDSLKEALHGANVVMLATNHTPLIKALTPAKLAAAGIKLVVDGKNALDAEGIAKAGILYYGVGRTRLPKKVMQKTKVKAKSGEKTAAKK